MNEDQQIVESAKAIRLNTDETALAMALARLSHEQWMQRRIQQGMVYGPERGPTTDPLLRPFDMMGESKRTEEVAAAKDILRLVRVLGYKIVREDTETPDKSV
jgi:hypothetical protein